MRIPESAVSVFQEETRTPIFLARADICILCWLLCLCVVVLRACMPSCLPACPLVSVCWFRSKVSRTTHSPHLREYHHGGLGGSADVRGLGRIAAGRPGVLFHLLCILFCLYPFLPLRVFSLPCRLSPFLFVSLISSVSGMVRSAGFLFPSFHCIVLLPRLRRSICGSWGRRGATTPPP